MILYMSGYISVKLINVAEYRQRAFFNVLQ